MIKHKTKTRQWTHSKNISKTKKNRVHTKLLTQETQDRGASKVLFIIKYNIRKTTSWITFRNQLFFDR